MPVPEHLILRCSGQVLHGRVGADKVQIVRKPLLHTGLLQNDFGKPDGIRVAGVAPGQVAAVPWVPFQETVCKPRVLRRGIN